MTRKLEELAVSLESALTNLKRYLTDDRSTTHVLRIESDGKVLRLIANGNGLSVEVYVDHNTGSAIQLPRERIEEIKQWLDKIGW